jgi:hypothetical protein
MINLSDFYSAGYFLIRANRPAWPQLSVELLPNKLISLSGCICPRLDITWGWTPGDPQAALDFGITEARLDEFLHWCKKEFETDVDYPGMFYSLDAARHFIRRFIADTNGLFLIGVGLPQNLLETARQRFDSCNIHGIERQLTRRLPLENGAAALGFEVVSFSYNDFGDSWLCSGLERDMHRLFGIRPNPYGLIDTYEDAIKVYDWIAEDDMQGRRAEPEPYYPWLLVSYPLRTGSPD